MKMSIFLLLFASLLYFSCSRQESNPFFSEYQTPFQTPPFDKIKEHHYKPAFLAGIKQQQEQIAVIAGNNEPPTFANTIAAVDYSGELLTKVSNVFNNLHSAHTNDTLQQIAREMAPLLAKNRDDIFLNDRLFQRIKIIYERQDSLALSTEQKMLLKKYYQNFVRGGANLDNIRKEELREINKQLSELALQFGENVLKEDNAFTLSITDQHDLAGLPPNVVTAAADAAREQNKEGQWIFTLHKPSLIPFLQYSGKRDMREKMFKAYINRGNNNDQLDNKSILARIVNLRIKKARLLGYQTYADFVLAENMAQNPQNVYALLNEIWTPALARAKKEAMALQEMIQKEGQTFKLQPWDWWYYTEKLRKEKYALDEELLRPYFELKQVIDGVFMVASKLYGITFTERKDIPTYHPDVKVFELQEADGRHIGILFTDYFPRSSKRGGAWMNDFRGQYKKENEIITPIIVNVGNFSKPTSSQPALLSFEEVSTLFHEFGHALHGLLSNCRYPLLSGTSVARDFVELPSQLMENWAAAPEVLKMYARHYQTHEPIPDELITKLKKSEKFNQGFITVEYLAAAFLDMGWHTLTQSNEIGVLEFENNTLQKIGLIPEIVTRYRSPYFQHIFSGGYSAGYYSYIWAEVLDADAFQAFQEKGLFDPQTARAFRENILASGGTEEPLVLYKRFRGAEPKKDALLERKGFN
jgi:peptidyl-dipeptidase Dcp